MTGKYLQLNKLRFVVMNYIILVNSWLSSSIIPTEPLSWNNGGSCCTDHAWRDSRGYSCKNYNDYNWCKFGTYGSGWNEVWGLFEAYSDSDGFDASEKCCPCGLRDDPVDSLLYCDLTTTEPTNWNDKFGHTCDDYISNVWCVSGTVGPEWKDWWGSIQSLQNQAGISADEICCGCISRSSLEYDTYNCTLFPELYDADIFDSENDWVDTYGDNCASYRYKNWCVDGTYGPYWDFAWGSFQPYAVNGISAPDICCECIPSYSSLFTRQSCYGYNTTWVDISGRTCKDYKDKGLCKGGTYGRNWDFSVGTFLNFASEVDFKTIAPQVCCECIMESNPLFQELSCIPHSNPVSSDLWTDSAGNTCSVYATQGYCTDDGGIGHTIK